MIRRPQPPPLLRPPRHGLRRFFAAGLLLGGVLIGLVLGLALPLALAPVPLPAPAPTAALASPEPPFDPGPDPASDLAADLAGLRQAVTEERARLEATMRLRGEMAALPVPPAPIAAPPLAPRREAAPPPTRPIRPEAPPPVAAAASPRVVVHYRSGSGAGAGLAADLVGQLRENGFESPEPRAVAGVPGQRVVRYFHAEDAATAARLAGRLGRGWAIQDFRGFEPQPSPQSLEVWLPDR